MRISVRTRTTKHGLEPCSIYLGGTRLPVVRVLACHELPEQRCYEVGLLDGRCFVIHHEVPGNIWELEAVHTERQRRVPAQRTAAAIHLSALGLVLRKMRKAVRSAVKLRQRDDVVPA